MRNVKIVLLSCLGIAAFAGNATTWFVGCNLDDYVGHDAGSYRIER